MGPLQCMRIFPFRVPLTDPKDAEVTGLFVAWKSRTMSGPKDRAMAKAGTVYTLAEC
jgi:hypothetical protein